MLSVQSRWICVYKTNLISTIVDMGKAMMGQVGL